jgi:hypothetical protein
MHGRATLHRQGRVRRLQAGGRVLMLAMVLCGALATLFAVQAAAQQADAQRTVSGIVTDDQHEPLRGAVVELENPATHVITSYITTEDGRYFFRRLDSHADYNVWATFRGHRSNIGHVSMYDSHAEKVLNLVCKTY